MDAKQVSAKAAEAFTALGDFLKNEEEPAQYYLNIVLHNIDLNAHAYPMQLVAMAHCPYDLDSRLCFILPNECEKRFDLQKSMEDASIMNGSYEQQAKFAR